MAGEALAARRIVAEALEAVAQDEARTAEAMMFALLQEALSALRQSRSRADLESFISFHLENCDESEFVVTRGC